MATAVALAGVEYPEEKNGEKIKPLEGKSLDAAFKGKTNERDALFWEHEGNCAIRKGDWKLVRKWKKPWELYNINKDRSELHDLAAKKPNLVKELSAEFQAYADRADVMPIGAWKEKKTTVEMEIEPSVPPDPELENKLAQAIQPKLKADPKPKKKTREVFIPIEDQPGLPRVLLIGDSISIGYTLLVRELLQGKANVHRPPTNCASTKHGLESIEQWLGDKKWDVIHFNWGLHDLKYMGPKGLNLADPKDPTSAHQVSPEQYEKNLTKLVARLKKTGAKLIWRNTTPVPEGAKGRVAGDSAKYNAIAKKIMEANDIPIDDLFALSKKYPGFQRKADVHYTAQGSKKLAEQVAKAIEAQLE